MITNPFVAEALGTIGRHLIGFLVGGLLAVAWLQMDRVSAGILALAGVCVLGWSLHHAWRARQKLLTAMATYAGIKEAEVEALVRAGKAPPVRVPKTYSAYLKERAP